MVPPVAPTPAARPARGFTLIEVLVVILVMTFGLLGIAALQANTAKFKVNAWVRASASVVFADLADRLRANPRQAGGEYVAGTGTAATPSAYVYAATWSDQTAVEPPAPTMDCLAVACDPAQRAAYDLAMWRADVRRLFPQGSVHIEGDVGPNGVRATVAWFDRTAITSTGALVTPDVCPAAPTDPATAANCCPAALAAPAGVRCARVSIVP